MSELQEVESFRLVRTKLNEKVTFLEAQPHGLNEIAFICIGEEERDDFIAFFKA